MFDHQAMLDRANFRPIPDKQGNPTDSGIVTVSRLLRFHQPHYVVLHESGGVSLRLEWMGLYLVRRMEHGGDQMRVQREMLDELGRDLVETCWRNISIQRAPS